MKIAISAQGTTLNANVDPRFGRCQYFMIVDTNTGEHHAIANEANASASGAGIKSAGMVVEQGVDAVLSGQVGPNAAQVLETANVKMYNNVSGTVADAIERFKNGEYQEA